MTMNNSTNNFLLPEALAKLEENPASHRLCKPGQPLTAAGVLPNRVMVILEGQARLLTKENSQPATLLKLGRGDVVGLASLLSASPCEIVHASTTVRAGVIFFQFLKAKVVFGTNG